MKEYFQQVTQGRWPNGIDRPIATLRSTPEELSHDLGIHFTWGQDELDRFQEAALRMNSGRPVLLTRYERSREEGTNISVDCEDNAAEALKEVCEAFGIRNESLS